MFSGTFIGIPLKEYIGIIHDVNVWNFNDPNHQCLKSPEFRALMTHLVADLASDHPHSPNLVDNIIKVIGPAVGIAMSVPPAAPFVFPAAILWQWLHGPMEFTKEHSRGLATICPAMVNLVLKEHSRLKGSIHEVKSYVNDTTFAAFQPKGAIDRISNLVEVEQYKELHKAVISAASKDP